VKIHGKNFAVIIAFSAFGLTGAEVQKETQWQLVPSRNAAGAARQLADGYFEIDNTGIDGHLMLNCGSEFAIIPQARYIVSCQVKCDNPIQTITLMLNMPGGRRLRRPLPSTPPVGAPAEFKSISLDFAAQEGERRLSIYLMLRGTGKTIVRNIKVEKFTPNEELFLSDRRAWKIHQAQNAIGDLTKTATGGYLLRKSGSDGYLSFVPDIPFEIFPGKRYRVEAIIRRDTPAVSCNLMVSMPGAKRTPYPSIGAKKPQGENENLSYEFTAEPDEKNLMIYINMRGIGAVIVSAISLKALDE